MKTKDFEISSSLFGGYKKKDVENYCKQLRDLLEHAKFEQVELQKRYNHIQQANLDLESQLAKAEVAYRGLWDKSKMMEATMNRQHQLLIQINSSKGRPFRNLGKIIEDLKNKHFSFNLLQIGGAKEDD